MSDKQKYIALFVTFAIIMTCMILLRPKRMSKEEYYQQVPKPTTIEDIYLVYKLWFDRDWRAVDPENGHNDENKY